MKDDDFEFSHTKVIMRRSGHQFYATIKARPRRKEDIDTSKLKICPIPRAHIYPVFLTQAPNSISIDTFLKTPNLMSYANSRNLTEISSLFMHEAQMCERMKRSPHPNVAKYFGCHLDQYGLITGLCFKRYQKTLHQMVKAREVFDQLKCLSDIKAGIEHLHSLGIIHCDINPHNVMLDVSTFVITDFDSCTMEGDELGAKAGTDGWTSDDFEFAHRENDWFGLEKIKEFLSPMKTPKSDLKGEAAS
jgi:serine/threonine protein kinase